MRIVVYKKHFMMFLIGFCMSAIVGAVGFIWWKSIPVGGDQLAEVVSVAETSRGNILIVVHPSTQFEHRLEICKKLIDLLRLEPALDRLIVGFEITEDRYLIIKCNTDDPMPIESKLRYEYSSMFKCYFGTTYLWEFPENYVPPGEGPGYAVDAIDTKSAAELKSDLKALLESGLGERHRVIKRIRARIEILEGSMP